MRRFFHFMERFNQRVRGPVFPAQTSLHKSLCYNRLQATRRTLELTLEANLLHYI